MPQTPAERDDDRACELASIGAGHAAGALAALVGETVRMNVPRLVRALGPDTLAPTTPDDAPSLAICFELDGPLGGGVSLLVPRDVERTIVARLCRVPAPADLDGKVARSALQEMGNVVASHLASAIADQLGARIMPSLPHVERRDPAAPVRAQVERAARAGCPSVVISLASDSRAVRVIAVLAPARRLPALA